MSPLTKLCVGLLVVLSLILTAATVVFVNQVDNFKESASAAKLRLDAADAKSEAMRLEVDATRATAQASVTQSTTQLEQAKQQINALQQQLVQKDTQLAQVTSQQLLQGVENTTLAGGMKEALETSSRLQEQVTELRSSNDKLVTQQSQLNMSVTDLQNKLEVTERERRLLSEQLTESRGQADKQSAMLKEMGITPAQFAMVSPRLSPPAINGVIRDVRSINGVPWASISVGLADSVTPGMEFKVVSRSNGAFLGLLKVDSVEQNTATGRLEGPRITEIRAGAEVKTQL